MLTVNSFPTTLPPGNWVVTLALSSAEQVLTLSKVAEVQAAAIDDVWPTPILRSYDGFEWELAPGSASRATHFTLQGCDNSSCTLDLPAAGGYVFRVEAHDSSLGGSTTYTERAAAKFLSQASFGPTRDTVHNLSAALLAAGETGAAAATPPSTSATYSEWIDAQMALPPTLHRAYYRARSSPRAAISTPAGTVHMACDVGSRWNRYALTLLDEGRHLNISVSEAGVLQLFIGGVLRTNLGPGESPWEGYVCSVVERVGGYVRLGSSCTYGFNEQRNKKLLRNPALSFDSATEVERPLLDLAANEASFSTLPWLGITSYNSIHEFVGGDYPSGTGDVLVLESLSASCALSAAAQTTRGTLLRYDGLYYQLDPRLQKADNTLEAPASSARSTDSPGLFFPTCASAPKTFLNAATCIRATTCSAPVASSAVVVLNHTSLRRFYELANLYVYSVNVSASSLDFPCTDTTRWESLGAQCGAEATPLDEQTKASLVQALQSSADGANPVVRDVAAGNSYGSCTDTVGDVTTKGAKVQVDGTCWTQAHPRQHNVYDYTYFSEITNDYNTFGGADPIKSIAWAGRTTIDSSSAPARIKQLGKLSGVLDFKDLPASVQTEKLAAAFGASLVEGSLLGEVCGSPGEVREDPSLGHHYAMLVHGGIREKSDYPQALFHDHQREEGRGIIHASIAVAVDDQLRQRMAWALSQTFVVSAIGAIARYFQETEMFVNYYDIFVRHAFGNLGDVLREVAYSPVMGESLSYHGGKSFARTGLNPDQNFARELMQLFTIGLWELQPDGLRQLDAEGQPIATYDMLDVMEMSRAWTGFFRQPWRGNIESEDPYFSQKNFMDPMQIKGSGPLPTWGDSFRDLFPKMDLHDAHLGDAQPLCTQLPPRAFLRKGARYVRLGSSPSPLQQYNGGDSWFLDPANGRRLTLPAESALRTALCSGAEDGADCAFVAELQLSEDLPCAGEECEVQEVITVALSAGGETLFYEYVRPPCVELAFPSGEMKEIKAYFGGGEGCADPASFAAGVACCDAPAQTKPSSHPCKYVQEYTSFDEAATRCAAAGQVVCQSFSSLDETDCGYARGKQYVWLDAPCSAYQVQVDSSFGEVRIVSQRVLSLRENSGTVFRVRWAGGNFPDAAACAAVAACEFSMANSACLCDVAVESAAVFTDSATVPSASEVEEQLRIGSSPPDAYDAGEYVECTAAPCVAAEGVAVFTPASSAGAFDAAAIFRIHVNGTTPRYLRNTASVVRIPDTNFSFRNPPTFHALMRPSTRDAAYETEALLDHLLRHKNTAPFHAQRLLQRFGSSNPSPRYVAAVAAAFTSGTYGGRAYSSKIGDLAATLAAVLLHPEARSLTLDADPSSGQLREPLLKLYHLLRAMEFRGAGGGEVDLSRMDEKIGMGPYLQPSVFNFYSPGYQPLGPLSSARLVSPEAMLLTGPYLLGFLNGAAALIHYGLSNAGHVDGKRYKFQGSGFGGWTQPSWLTFGGDPDTIRARSSGVLMFQPQGETPAGVVAELALLLTDGRLSAEGRRQAEAAYAAELERSSAADALRLLQELLVLSPEFHATNEVAARAKLRSVAAEVASQGRPYKAIVYIYLNGGADSYNFLAPKSGCVAGRADYSHYNNARDGVALPSGRLLAIAADSSTQGCSSFGVHYKLPKLRDMYNDGDALFVANVGSLVEPTSRASIQSGDSKLPPSLFAHNTQAEVLQNLHPQKTGEARGVLGRIMDAVSAPLSGLPYRSKSYSIAGQAKILESDEVGTPQPQWLTSKGQITELARTVELGDHLTAVLAANQSASPFAETYTNSLASSVDSAVTLASVTAQNLATNFPEYDDLTQQLKQVAKVIKARESLLDGVERDVFYVEMGGFDSHDEPMSTVLVQRVNVALTAFTNELKAQGVWDDVAILSGSEFGRRMHSNGQGTDHGWGGHTFLMGGGVRGGQILGEYPADLNGELNYIGGIIPTISWDAVWHGIAQWFGVEDGAAMEKVLPNLPNFAAPGCSGPGCGVFSAGQLFA